VPRPRKISDFKPLLTNLAQTSHYQVIFGGLPAGLLDHLLYRGIDLRFIGESAGLLCSSAVLPGSSFATTDIVGNFTGVTEKMVHTRQFTQIDLEFYVDSGYRSLKFLEHWMEYIASGSGVSPYQPGYFFRMRYPDQYKTNQTRIIKFDRDYNREIEYVFYGLFPISLNSVSVNYGTSDILKATASFNFERYVSGKAYSFDIYNDIDNNKNQIKDRERRVGSGPNPQRLASGREEMIWRNLNVGTGRLDDPRPRGIGGSLSPSQLDSDISRQSVGSNVIGERRTL
jgi:hypothetical protein